MNYVSSNLTTNWLAISLIFVLSLFTSTTTSFANDEWVSARDYIQAHGASKVEQGDGAVFYTRIEERSLSDLQSFDAIIASGSESIESTQVCGLFFAQIKRMVNYRVDLTQARTSRGRIGCVFRHNFLSGSSGYQIFFIESVGKEVYQLAFKN